MVMASLARDTVDKENENAAASRDLPCDPPPQGEASMGEVGVALIRLGSTLRTTYMSVDVFCHIIHDMFSADSAVWECLSDPMDLADLPAVISFADRTWELEPMIEENFIRISTAIREVAVGMGLEITEHPLTTRLRRSLVRVPDCTQYLVFDYMILSQGVSSDPIDDDADDDGPSRAARQPAAPVMSVLRSTGSGSDTDHSVPMLLSSDSSDDDGADDGPSRAARYGSEAHVLTPYLQVQSHGEPPDWIKPPLVLRGEVPRPFTVPKVERDIVIVNRVGELHKFSDEERRQLTKWLHSNVGHYTRLKQLMETHNATIRRQ
eukprot:gene5982-7190_t